MAKYIINIEDGEADESNNGELCVTAIINDRLSVKKLTPYEEPEQEKPGRWRGKDYWYINQWGDPRAGIDSKRESDNWLYDSGNYFRTREEAEEYRESLIAYNELKAYAEPDDAAWDEKQHFYLYSDFNYEKLKIGTEYNSRCCGLYFDSPETARSAIEAVGVERIKRYYLGIKED